jgi:2-desacetyl-2-hydroxyethyl bacteriochlorophyllide A dehydrogenase
MVTRITRYPGKTCGQRMRINATNHRPRRVLSRRIDLRRRPAGSQMRAAVITGPLQFKLIQTDVPRPKPNQILVRIVGCGVCASNIPPWQGKPWFNYPLEPGALGHEAWGRVVELGSAVEDFEKGDRVAILSHNAYAEYDVCDAKAAVRLSPELKNQPFPGEPLGCALNIFERSKLDLDDTVAIVGVGFLGTLLTQLVSASGAKVIAIARHKWSLRQAREMGAAATIRLEDPAEVIEQVKRLTQGKLCDVVFEVTGHQNPLDLAAELTGERGRLVIAGYHQDGPRQINLQLWNWRGFDVINAHERDPRVSVHGIRQAIHAIKAGLLRPASLYTHFFPLQHLDVALNMAAERPPGFVKAMVTT